MKKSIKYSKLRQTRRYTRTKQEINSPKGPKPAFSADKVPRPLALQEMRDYAVVSSNGLVLALAGHFLDFNLFWCRFYGFDGFDGFYGPSRRIYLILLMFMPDLDHIDVKGHTHSKYLPLRSEYI